MSRILLLVEQKENRRLLSEWLAGHHEVLLPDEKETGRRGAKEQEHNREILLNPQSCRNGINWRLLSSQPERDFPTLAALLTTQHGQGTVLPLPLSPQSLILNTAFDLCVLDSVALKQFWEEVQARKAAELPVFLPFLLIVPRQDVGLMTRHPWKSVDELVTIPIEKMELQKRVEMLLRTRQLSWDLKHRNAELKETNERSQQEIVKHQQAEAQLRQSEEKFRQFLEAAPDAIAIVGASDRIVLVNTQIEKMFGYERDELLGNTLEMLLPDYIRRVHDRERTDSCCEPQVPPMGVGFELFARRKDGTEFPVDVSLSHIETPQGFLVTSIIRNITVRKQAEEEIHKALEQERQLGELKSRFVSMVSHEFRNPLTSISLSAHMLEHCSNEWSQEKKSKYLLRIKDIVRNMTDLLEDVLLIGRADAGKSEFNPVPLDLTEFCRNLVEEIQLSASNQHEINFVSNQTQFKLENFSTDNYSLQDSNLECLTVTENEFETIVSMDEKLLRQILNNLLSNAIKYSPEGGIVHFGLTCQNGDATFQIRDEGIGIPPADLARLFETFHRAKNVGKIPGTGLGLAIVKRCVEIHGGKIAVDSQVGLGTTFTVTLPC
ncbi:PAS domain-containing sensor histidine kinase [Trichocoleus sp. ST-U3]